MRSTISPTDERLLEGTDLSALETVAARIASAEPDAILLARGRERHELDDYLRERGLPDAMLTVLRAEDRVVGVLLVGQRAGEVSTFNADDRKLFETFASHAGVLLENDRVKEQLRYQAYHDALTGLPNRLLFAEQVRQAITTRPRPAEAPSVLFLDLDDFKTINDSLGHGAGDGLLVAVAERLRSSVRPGDTVARLGGDEFAVLLDQTGHRRRREGGRTARRGAARAVRPPRPRDVDPRQHRHRRALRLRARPTSCSRNADVAMYSAKDNGKRGYAVYEPEMHARVRRRQELIASVERAVERSEITVHYQPIVSLETGRDRGARGARPLAASASGGSFRRAASSRSPRRPA